MTHRNREIPALKTLIACLCILCCCRCVAPSDSDRAASQFRKHVLTKDFISEGVTVADVNKDGQLDIMAGMYWFEAPAWTRHEIDSGRSFDPETEYSDSFLNFSLDVNMDTWNDLVVVDFPGTSAVWYENPKNNNGWWTRHIIYDSVGNESPMLVDVDNDGRGDLLFGDVHEGEMVWLRAPSDPSDLVWRRFPISEKGAPGTGKFSHGLGFGDVNGDGRADVVIKDGWWEGPPDPRQPLWKFHEIKISDPCSQMYVTDVNGDALPDVVSASAHLAGVWWQEQKRDNAGNISFDQRVISYAFAESHALALADLNNDGHKDIVTGKRNLKRGTWRKNPGTHGPPLLYWYEFIPGGDPNWIAHEIDNGSGAGLNLEVRDINGDGLADIAISNFNGVFFFENVMTGSNAE